MLAKMPEEKEENTETFLEALNAFERKPSREIPSELEQLLCRIACNGEPLFPWSKLKPLVVTKLENVIQEYIQTNPCEEVPMLPNVENVKFDDMRERLLRALNAFNSAPFTMQRLCELLTHPKRYYQRSDKFMRGVEKNVQVVSTVTPTGKRITHSCEVRNRSLMMNGVLSDIHTQTSTPASDCQASGEATPTEEPAHTNGAQATAPPPLPLGETATPAQEQSVDSTRPNAETTTPEVALEQSNERTTSGDDESPLSDNQSQESAEASSSEADACKPTETPDPTVSGDSDDSDGNKGDGDQDSCSSMDSADSGDSSPDSALPPRTGYFATSATKDNNAPTHPSPEPKGTNTELELVESSTDIAGSQTADEPSTEATSTPQPDQSHSSITPPPQEEQASPLAVTEATDTTDQSERVLEPSDGVEPPVEEPANRSDASTEEISQSGSSSEETTVTELTEVPMDQE